MSGTIVQIVPLRGIAPEGVGDYARGIAERLLDDHGRRTIFVSGTPLPAARRLVDRWETHEVAERSARALLDTLDSVDRDAPVVLHLSAYGYHPKGTPFWLLSALRRWRRARPDTPLVTVFHELFATGPIWGSAFWIGPLQAHVARRLQEISTAATATTEPYAALLRRWRGGRAGSGTVLPVFSTIGETAPLVPASARARTLAIFGRNSTIYRDRLPAIAAFVTANEITDIVDLGRRDTAPPRRIAGAAVRSLGEVSGARLRSEMSRALFGMLDYDADRLAKSTVFAAYCANGAIPVCLSDARGTNDGLVPGVNYVKLARDGLCPRLDGAALQALQRAAEDWYLPHSLSASTQVILALLERAPDLAEGI